jgi:hypothetical protein
VSHLGTHESEAAAADLPVQVELVDRCHYRTRAEAQAWIFTWIHWFGYAGDLEGSLAGM